MENRIDQIKKAIAAGIVLLLILTAVAIVIKYNEEGEENMPFEISKILSISTAVGDTEVAPESIENNVIQNNDVYLEIKKNDNYNKEAIIKSIEFSNIQITKAPIKGEVKAYMPNTEEDLLFKYTDEYLIENNSLTYKGSSKTDTKALEINNQGGMIVISFANSALGKYQVTSEGVTTNGTMLKDLGVSNEDIKFSVNFDLIINTENKTFKTNISLDLPAGDIITEGKTSLEITDTSKYIFKRVND